MSNQQHHILVVDDLADNIFLLQAFLESEGYTVDVADTASLALEKMQALPPDLVLLDVMMPNMDGYELTRAIRKDSKLRSIPIVLITAHTTACRVKGLAAGATDFVRKPINFEQLLLTIEQLIAFQAKLKR
ncbi:response regulator [Oculatella sp. LEGE 06141]|uniref:response regulator n=1 Tax=Oculatella sp. LEGE 06141 TaxID=1828648 RepID=UPI0018811D9A|nr:response regulator [Oculatella sp. LEGE 06141]MBE9182503.1 response regulator [Oculatella sp. LEGE 06141]